MDSKREREREGGWVGGGYPPSKKWRPEEKEKIIEKKVGGVEKHYRYKTKTKTKDKRVIEN